MTDIDLQRAILAALADSPPVQADEISVVVTNGAATLRGTVGTPLQRFEAVRAARAVPGVASVDDRLEARLLDFEGREDADTAAAVIDALIGDSELHTADIDVTVKAGGVTLDGVVAYASQRERAERLALAVGGVTGVENRLRALATISADEVAERVGDAIGATAVTGTDHVTVCVRDGDVILTGSVRSRQDRDAALAAAARAPGVADVHDELSIRG